MKSFRVLTLICAFISSMTSVSGMRPLLSCRHLLSSSPQRRARFVRFTMPSTQDTVTSEPVTSPDRMRPLTRRQPTIPTTRSYVDAPQQPSKFLHSHVIIKKPKSRSMFESARAARQQYDPASSATYRAIADANRS